jgi:hypothetical protein
MCYNDYVIISPSNYNNAYFEEWSVHVFGTSSAIDIPPGTNGMGRENRAVSLLWTVGDSMQLTSFIFTQRWLRT